MNFSIVDFVTEIPSALINRSGKVFYSGRQAFSRPSSLYVLGVNPGGDPNDQFHINETVGHHTQIILDRQADWSAYRDESWKGTQPGTFGMAPRVLHLFGRLRLNPGDVPASNLVFVRSSRESMIDEDMNGLADQCWGFHAKAIRLLQPRVILCFGKTAGNYVRKMVHAHQMTSEFVESNQRMWRSQAFRNSQGLVVIVATHPSVADWTASATDPTSLVAACLR